MTSNEYKICSFKYLFLIKIIYVLWHVVLISNANIFILIYLNQVNHFFQSKGCVDTAIWMHYIDAN